MSGREWGTFSEALLLLASRDVPGAEDALDEAISNGVVQRRGDCACDDVIADQTIPPLRGKSKYRTLDSVLPVDPCEINMQDVATWARALSSGVDREETRGRKPRIDWDAFWLAVCIELFENGLAETQVQFLERVDDRLNGAPEDQLPGRTMKAERISKLYQTLR